jgi:hypothetical protein
MGLGSGIQKNLFWISDLGVKKAPDPGSGSATLGATISGIPYWYDTVQYIGMCTGVLPKKETKGMQIGRYRYWYGSKVWYHY